MSNKKAYEFLIKDPTLKDLVSRFLLPEIKPAQEPLEGTLIRSVVSQQLSVKAADTIYQRFIGSFDNNLVTLEILINRTNEELRAVGLSKQKAGYVRNVAHFFLQEENQDKDWMSLDNEEIVNQLTSIKGVGEWTVHMILIFNLNRMDVLPLGDLIVKQGLMNLLRVRDESKKGMARIVKKCEKWSPYRSYVSRLMWAAKDELT